MNRYSACGGYPFLGSDRTAIAIASQGLSARNPGLTTPARLGDTPKVPLNFPSSPLDGSDNIASIILDHRCRDA
jgi:hypothetical protein